MNAEQIRMKYKNSFLTMKEKNYISSVYKECLNLIGLSTLTIKGLSSTKIYIVEQGNILNALVENEPPYKEVSINELEKDCYEYLESVSNSYHLENEKYIQSLLTNIHVSSTSIKKINATIQDLIEQGFIQSITNDKISLWWEPIEGIRIIAVCGLGIYRLTDIDVSLSKLQKGLYV